MTYDSPCVYNLEQDSRKASQMSAQTYYLPSLPTSEKVANWSRSQTPSKAYISALKARVVTLENLLDEILGAEADARDVIVRRIRQQRNRDTEQSTEGRARDDLADNQAGRDVQDESDDEDSDKEEWDAVRDMTSRLAHLDVDDAGIVYSVGACANATREKPAPRTSGIEGGFDVRSSSGPPAVQFQLSPLALESFVNPTYLTPLEHHLLRLYFTWQHPVAHLFSEDRFMRDLCNGFGSCYSPLLLSVLLSIGAHYSRLANEQQGDVYFVRAKTLLSLELERPSLPTCQALVLMGSREAGCGREHGSGWLYSGMGFRMQIALGTDRNLKKVDKHGRLSTEEIEERAFTYYGSFIHVCAVITRIFSK